MTRHKTTIFLATVDGRARPEARRALEEEHRLYALLTTEANGVVGPVHPKATPVLLTTLEEWRT